MSGGVRVRRGRAAAYRPIWQWPLRSIPHALITTAVVLAAAAGISSLSTFALSDTAASTVSGPTTTITRPSTPTATPSAPPAATSGPTSSTPTATPPAAPQPAAADPAQTETVGVATSWTAAWLTANRVTPAQWLAALKPYTTEEYLGLLSSVDPANVPQGAAGRPTIVSAKTSSAIVNVPIGAATLRLSLIRAPGGWLVANSDRG